MNILILLTLKKKTQLCLLLTSRRERRKVTISDGGDGFVVFPYCSIFFQLEFSSTARQSITPAWCHCQQRDAGRCYCQKFCTLSLPAVCSCQPVCVPGVGSLVATFLLIQTQQSYAVLGQLKQIVKLHFTNASCLEE